MSIRSITVYCSSSSKVAPGFSAAAAELGRAIAQRGWQLVYGGNRVGMMGVLAESCQKSGGWVVGITPQFFIDSGIGDDKCSELVVARDMRHRKELLEQRGDALVALPGGLGTLEEFFEVLVAKALGHHSKPIVVLNIDGFFQPLLAMIDHGVELNFIRPKARDQFYVSDTVEEAMEYLGSC